MLSSQDCIPTHKKRFFVEFDDSSEEELVEWMHRQRNVQAYIKRLIFKDFLSHLSKPNTNFMDEEV